MFIRKIQSAIDAGLLPADQLPAHQLPAEFIFRSVYSGCCLPYITILLIPQIDLYFGQQKVRNHRLIACTTYGDIAASAILKEERVGSVHLLIMSTIKCSNSAKHIFSWSANFVKKLNNLVNRKSLLGDIVNQTDLI